MLILELPPLDKLYKEFFTRNEITNEVVTIVTYDNLYISDFSLCGPGSI